MELREALAVRFGPGGRCGMRDPPDPFNPTLSHPGLALLSWHTLTTSPRVKVDINESTQTHSSTLRGAHLSKCQKTRPASSAASFTTPSPPSSSSNECGAPRHGKNITTRATSAEGSAPSSGESEYVVPIYTLTTHQLNPPASSTTQPPSPQKQQPKKQTTTSSPKTRGLNRPSTQTTAPTSRSGRTCSSTSTPSSSTLAESRLARARCWLPACNFIVVGTRWIRR